MSDAVTRAREIVAGARRVAVMTGAGISAESGVPTFRGAGGMWRNRPAQQLATPTAFAADPSLVWEFYLWRRQKLVGIEPNPAHHALATLEQRLGDDFVLITQNVDGLHHAAGSQRIITLHGDIWIDRCSNCEHERRVSEVASDVPVICAECGALMRPGVVWFGEPVPAIEGAAEAVLEVDAMLVIGTSGVVEPAASLARLARGAHAEVIELNLEETPLTPFATVFVPGPAGASLPQIVG